MIGSSIMVLIILYYPVFSEAVSGPYQLVSEFSSNSIADGKSTGIFVDDVFNIYIAEPSQHRVDVFNQSGQYLKSLTLGPTGQPIDVAVDKDRNIFVLDMLSGRVTRFTSDIQINTSILVNMPCGLDVDASGNLYVREKDAIVKFNSVGHFLDIIAHVPSQTNGIESCPIEEANQSIYYTRNHEIKSTALNFTPELPPNQRTVYDIAADSQGNVFVMTAPWEIKKLNSNGKFITGFEFEDEFFSNHTGTFWNSKITTDSEGTVYVLDSTNGKVLKFKQGGLGPAQFGTPEDIAQDSSSKAVYVADTGNVRIQKFTDTGDFVNRWGRQGTLNGYFISPSTVTVDSSGNVFVTDTNNNRIQKFTNSGFFSTKWGSFGTGDGQFGWLAGIAVDSSGNVYVVDSGNHRIQKFTNDGTFIKKWGSKCSIFTINSGCIDPDGTGPLLLGDGQFNIPEGVAVDSSGNVFVADGNHRIEKFTNDGTFITKWGSFGIGNGQFSSPEGVAVDSSGNVYVVDSGNHRIQKFTNDGTFITKWGSKCSILTINSGCIDPDGTGPLLLGDGQFNQPKGVAVDSSGNVYVADKLNDRIEKFTNNGTFIKKWGSHGSL